MSEFKMPTSQEEMDELRNSLRAEISDDDLEAVVGGNDDVKTKDTTPWTCHFCGAVVMCKSTQDRAKHIVQSCPNNPYK